MSKDKITEVTRKITEVLRPYKDVTYEEGLFQVATDSMLVYECSVMDLQDKLAVDGVSIAITDLGLQDGVMEIAVELD